MEASIYEYNKENLERQFPGIGEKLDSCLSRENKLIEEYTTQDGQLGLFVRSGEKGIQLNSKYNSRVYADIWADNVMAREQLSRKHVLFVFGYGNGDYVRALARRMPEDTTLICYEPSLDIFMKTVQKVNVQETMSERMAIFVEGINMDLFGGTWREAVTIANGMLVHMVVLPNYAILFQEELSRIITEIAKNNDLTQVEENTRERFSDVTAQNEIALLPYILKSYDLNDLFEKLPAGYPAIIVAAGPSLSKNIKELKKAKNKALIIAVDTSIKLLLEEGIVPDIYTTLDAKKEKELFSDSRIHDIPVCMAPYSIPEASRKQRNKIFVSMGNSYIGKMCKKMGKTLGFLGDGGTVAQIAFYLAMKARMSPIILVGQDLAYTNEQTHAKGVSYGTVVKNDDTDKDDCIWVEDIYGNPVRTVPNLNIYRLWYEDVIKNHNLRVINATEGGANIAGTEIATLRDVLELECTREFDFKEAIDSTCQLLTVEEQEYLKTEFMDMPRRFDEIAQSAQKSVEIYRRIKNNSETMDTLEIQQLLSQLGELSDRVEQYLEFLLVEPIIGQVSREAMENLENVSDDVEEDLRDIARRGEIMSQALVEAVPKLRNDVNDMLQML